MKDLTISYLIPPQRAARYVIFFVQFHRILKAMTGGRREMGNRRIRRQNGPLRSSSPPEGRLASRTPRSSTASSALSRTTPFFLFVRLFLNLPLSLFLPSSPSFAFCIRRPRAVRAVHLQPVNVRSASRPSTRYMHVQHDFSLFHCSLSLSLCPLLQLPLSPTASC